MTRPDASRKKEPYREVLAAIDVGTNAVRLELARLQSDGTLESLHQERDPVRPGEGLYVSGSIPREVANRLIATLKRYSALCRRFQANVRAVATSAVREAKNRDDIVRRAQREARLNLEVISGKEEARLICLGVLRGKPPSTHSLCLDIGGGSTEVALAKGEQPLELFSVDIGAVRLTEMFQTSGEVSGKQLDVMRRFAEEAIRETVPAKMAGKPKRALGSSGTINGVVSYASEGRGYARLREVSRAVDELSAMSPEKRRRRFDARRADIVVAGAVILEASMRHLGLEGITAVPQGLRDGLLFDLVRRQNLDPQDHSLSDAVIAYGRHLRFDEPHALQVCKMALSLFDELASLHQLPATVRPLLEAAALLHDVGNAINYQKHHKHSFYLIQQADIAGLADRERELVARIARYHRRTAPHLQHSNMQGLTPTEARWVRKASTLLRMADSLDKSHLQPVTKVAARIRGSSVMLSVKSRKSLELEVWDFAREAPVFKDVFGKNCLLETTGALK